jgi:Glycosyl hydrolases family 2, TIM barrel domain/Glycosyl hydrolases family 2, sugar binding domain/Glycosyl hydrolases family 2
LRARRAILPALLSALVIPAAARAQPVTYTATPPTAGALYRDGQTGRYLLGGQWLYRADPANAGLGQQWFAGSSTAGWSPVTVPNAFNAGDFSSASMTGSVGWYRRDFTLPAGAFPSTAPRSRQHWIVRFESVNYRASIWLNGRLIGTHAGAYLPFELDLIGLRKGVNRLVVRVDDHRSPTDLPPGPGGGWWNFGGLVREVYLRAVDAADLQQVLVTPVLPCPSCDATVQEQITVRNVTGLVQRVALTGRYGNVPLDFGTATIGPGGTWTATATALIPHPQLWSIDHPYLYRATLTLSDTRGHRLGGYTAYSGIRTIAVNAAGRLTLNGRPLSLRGAFIHEQNIRTGAALSPAQLAALMGWERRLGSTVIRSHYPLNPEILEMADRYGILVWDEVPVYQFSNSANTNDQDNTGDQYLGTPTVLREARSTLQQNILDNENHPSVLLWSIGNELSTPVTSNEARYISLATSLAHKVDPTRPVGMAVSDWPGVPCQTAYAPLDVIGFNDYFGWFDAGGGGTDDRDQLGPFLDSLRACYPTKGLMVTEFGFEANRHGPVEERGTYEFQSDSTAYHLGVFATKRWLSGAIYFALQDFAARPGWGGGDPWPDPPWVQKGLVDAKGNLRPAFSVASALFHATTQIAPRRRTPARRAAAPRRRHPRTGDAGRV